VTRKLILAALIAAGTAGGLTATASAQPPVAFDRHDHDHDRGRFRVLVRHRLHWDVHGTYRDRDDAQRAAPPAGATGVRRPHRTGPRVVSSRGWPGQPESDSR
jgi:hypothetical protein